MRVAPVCYPPATNGFIFKSLVVSKKWTANKRHGLWLALGNRCHHCHHCHFTVGVRVIRGTRNTAHVSLLPHAVCQLGPLAGLATCRNSGPGAARCARYRELAGAKLSARCRAQGKGTPRRTRSAGFGERTLHPLSVNARIVVRKMAVIGSLV